MVDLVSLFNELVDSKGKILVPGIYDQVAPLTEDEKKIYDSIDFNHVWSLINKLNYLVEPF